MSKAWPLRLYVLNALTVIGLMLAACGANIPPTPTFAPPTSTATPLSTPLPTVPSQVPFGASDRPYRVVVVPPPESDAIGRPLQSFLVSQVGRAFEVEVVSSQAVALTALCSDVPTFAWVDGWTMLAAQARGCGEPALAVQRGDANSTGIRSELVVSPASRITAVSGFKQRIYCRLGDQDLTSWILPVIVMRNAPDFDPFLDFLEIRDVPNTQALLTEVAFNRCVGAIPAGTLADYKVEGIADVTGAVSVLEGSTSPELPYGGLMVSQKVPETIATQVVRLFKSNLDRLNGLVEADALRDVSAADYEAISKLLQDGGIDFTAMGR